MASAACARQTHRAWLVSIVPPEPIVRRILAAASASPLPQATVLRTHRSIAATVRVVLRVIPFVARRTIYAEPISRPAIMPPARAAAAVAEAAAAGSLSVRQAKR